ncbi:hypothetical protein OEZ85_001731 [Tetradesmus obliquus]|uniref:Maf-like protein n=1 Tax=Tetradesmus obliquus TaxID=3088 RepID=A0ABY8U0V5_TETOB|nr:hypothetical protein OEZ85_001731 [Tetradesmus obliquus]
MDSLASQYSFKYEVLKADIDEKAIRHDTPRDLVLALAHAKADALLQKLAVADSSSNSSSAAAGNAADSGSSSSGTFLITCDQVVVHEGQMREKPEDVEEAHRFIHSYSRSPAQTVGSVLCTNVATGSRHQTVEVCTIHMNDMPDDVIDQLIAEGDVLWCAGGLMVEHPLVVPYITQIEGSQESVMGLGKEAVMSVLVAAAGL